MRESIWYSSLYIFIDKINLVFVYAAAALGFAVVNTHFNIGAGSLFLSSAIAAMLAIPVHSAILLGGDERAYSSTVFSPFLWRTMLLGVVGFVPAILVLVVAAVANVSKGPAILIFLLAWSFSAPWAFAKWGTMLPAAVVGDDTRFAAARTRGSRAFWYAFPRLLVSLVLLTIAAFALSVLLVLVFGLDPKHPAFALASLIFAPLGAYQVIMTSLILSRSYQIGSAQRA